MDNAGSDNKQKALSEILILTGLALIGILVSSGLSLWVVNVLFDIDAAGLMASMSPETAGENGRTALLLRQGMTAAGGFILFPALIRFFNPIPSDPSIRPNATLVLLITGLAVLMMPVNAWLAAWNQGIRLPSFLQDFQNWALAKEQEMERLTTFLVEFSGWQEGLLGFLVIALLAGLTEEFFFRKMLQPRLIRLTGNPHAGIWLTAFIFSAIHIQFYGLIPRMVLGALFGYYFYWTGNIALPMFAHMLNNGLTLLGLLLYQQKISPIDVENPEQIPWYLGAISAGIVWSLSSMLREESIKIRRQAIHSEHNSL